MTSSTRELDLLLVGSFMFDVAIGSCAVFWDVTLHDISLIAS